MFLQGQIKTYVTKLLIFRAKVRVRGPNFSGQKLGRQGKCPNIFRLRVRAGALKKFVRGSYSDRYLHCILLHFYFPYLSTQKIGTCRSVYKLQQEMSKIGNWKHLFTFKVKRSCNSLISRLSTAKCLPFQFNVQFLQLSFPLKIFLETKKIHSFLFMLEEKWHNNNLDCYCSKSNSCEQQQISARSGTTPIPESQEFGQ